ncbi:MAG TPA: Rieske 2Fe-2S domain-containing protein [Solirubrobacteraceae bacterium]|jgi:ubiquinol-cytochrome c reductase iron-sulfur subunit
MRKLWRWLVALITLFVGKLMHRASEQEDEPERIVPAGRPERRAETAVLILLAIAVAWAIGFVVTYAEFGPKDIPNALLGICLGMSLAFIAAALTVVAKRLVVTEEREDEYPEEHPQEQSEVAQIVHESGSRFTRKRLLIGASAATAAAFGAAAITPAASLGPFWDTAALDRTAWRRGRRLVDEDNRPFKAGDVETETFYTAFPEGADKEEIGSPVVLLRLAPSTIHLPAGRADWAPHGILAYSKICTHAGCAIALYRKPTFPAVEPKPALVCPCHYSTFDPATGASVTYGPAGRPLPQLPLMIDSEGHLRAAGNFSQRVGPSWWNVRESPT